MRAVSTVADASLCLLLVSASALTLAGTPVATHRSAGTGGDTADAAADLLATSTATARYAVGDRTRSAHDTLAGLLASAALARERSRVETGTAAFVSAVESRVERALARLDAGVQVRARPIRPSRRRAHWNHRARSVVAGPTPPPDADVHAAAFAVRGVRLTVRTWSA